MEFLKSIIIDNETPAADGMYSYVLPVNPVSHLILTICALNTGGAEATAAQICDMVTNVHVLHRGTTVLQMSANDLLALNHVLFAKTPMRGQQSATISDITWLSLVIPFGRKMYDPNECFPQSRAGELQIQLTVGIADAVLTGLILQLEAVELYGANPARHLKVTTIVDDALVVGDNDIRLPIGNPYAGILMFSTTKPTSTLWTTTIDQVKLLANNKEHYVSSANWESLRGELVNRPGMEAGYLTAIGLYGHDHIAQYAYIDFDPRRSDLFLMETAGMNALILRITGGDTEEARVFPVELRATS
ncbi:unnamed protein product [marine sediment metagenome]|uniref:Viral coat protein P2 N-terminal domain-containing protein n=1 Tax=marine sediment metagenome TaxID=412755 RepID=X1E7Y0_9ZZZZ